MSMEAALANRDRLESTPVQLKELPLATLLEYAAAELGIATLQLEHARLEVEFEKGHFRRAFLHGGPIGRDLLEARRNDVRLVVEAPA